MRDGRSKLAAEVFGQGAALDAAWAAITRSVVGLGDIHRKLTQYCPRTVLFLAGPPDTGKMELARSVARLLCGDDNSIIQFLMAGYQDVDSVGLLIGGPPGTIAHELGGLLKKAIREHPISVLLFDEIEKAHPRVLDVFLQVLNGETSDWVGDGTIRFDNSVLIFTSSLGVSWHTRPVNDETLIQGITPDLSYPDIVRRTRETLQHHFAVARDRPEFFSRLSDRLVVFDFLREEAGAQVMTMLIHNIVERVKIRFGTSVEISPQALTGLRSACLQNVSEGGRSIARAVESRFVNPLSGWIFERIQSLPTHVMVTECRSDGSMSIEVVS